MRVSQVYRWQIPMDAGVVLRERRLKNPRRAVHPPAGG
ncbi:O-succinylbenzoate synthase [Klebsiella pneumoniae IS22]|nr:O-succinylbenzoate synthase [Klebsiella pneumoniae IS22]